MPVAILLAALFLYKRTFVFLLDTTGEAGSYFFWNVYSINNSSTDPRGIYSVLLGLSAVFFDS